MTAEAQQRTYPITAPDGAHIWGVTAPTAAARPTPLPPDLEAEWEFYAAREGV
ncbi:hypothetical protein GCM10010123_41030 [Pilimelia anulata]|uniref:Uncharacterized protein n=1 Tax=Pilimelia anulata TaxID=53371 RepID=A0A8J3FE51_9ACTN|nr:hypothetical protein [Pilimelia anulata]GGK07044.1 hypothetical protein GCM10010123_41030 [Pilimelia anulata]